MKLFPADAIGGANYVKAIRSPFPQLKLMPTGGVRLDEDNLNEWFSAGVVCRNWIAFVFSRNFGQSELSESTLKYLNI